MDGVTKSMEMRQHFQEDEYLTPYHWSFEPWTEAGRSYFCYLDRVIKFIPPGAKSLLDVGSGDGRAISYFRDKLSSIAMTGSDYSERALDLAKIMSQPRLISWMRLDLLEIRPAVKQYDVVTAIEVIEHIPLEKLAYALKNIRSHLKANGRLIITVPSILVKLNKKHYQHFSRDTLQRALLDAGFKIETIEGQERNSHIFFFIYKFVDNRWFTIKPLMRWMNLVAYRKWVDRCHVNEANRLIVSAVAI